MTRNLETCRILLKQLTTEQFNKSTVYLFRYVDRQEIEIADPDGRVQKVLHGFVLYPNRKKTKEARINCLFRHKSNPEEVFLGVVHFDWYKGLQLSNQPVTTMRPQFMDKVLK